MPDLSVVMPVYNGARFLHSAIDSILVQTHADFELLVVNDASQDESANVVRGYDDPRVRLFENESNLGLAGTLNRALSLATAPLVARHDQDDVSHPRRFEWQIGYLARHPDIVLLGSQATVIDEAGNPIGQLDVSLQQASIRWALIFDNTFVHSSVMFRREVILAAGGYSDFRQCEDYELWSRIALRYQVANLPDRLLSYRQHGASMMGSLVGAKANRSIAENRFIIGRMLEQVFGHSFPDAEVDLAARLRLGIDGADLNRFWGLYKRLLREYMARYPEANGSPDLLRTVGEHARRISRGLSNRDRAAALHALVLGCRYDPRLLISGRGLRTLASIVSGNRGNNLYASLLRWRASRSG